MSHPLSRLATRIAYASRQLPRMAADIAAGWSSAICVVTELQQIVCSRRFDCEDIKRRLLHLK